MNVPVNHNEKTVLGLDIGTNSIGWALVGLEDSSPRKLIDSGVRIFNRAVEDKVPTPKNAKRRQARLARRVVQRRARRRQRLRNYLIKLELLPRELTESTSPERLLNQLGDPYALRTKALDESLTEYELGRVLLHLVQRRGFLSNRKSALGDLADDPDVLAVLAEEDDQEAAASRTEEGLFKQQISNLRERIKTSGSRTLGEFLFYSDELESKRNRIRNGGDLRTDRAMYRTELDLIWKQQEKHHSVLTEDVREQLEEVIFYQRPLKLKSDRIGRCSLESANKRSALARLEFQEYRYLQDVNNLSYIDPYTNTDHKLTDEQRAKIIPLFEAKNKVTYPQIRKALGLDKTTLFNLEAAENKKLKGNLTSLAIADVLNAWDVMTENKKLELVEDLLTIKKKSVLNKRLQNHWGLSIEDSVSLCLLEFEEGHANLSLKAIKKLLPHMRDGLRYDKARVAAGYGYEKADAESMDKLPVPPVITNPIVNRGLSEVRKVVNAVIKAYGKPDVIRVEMARDLEMNTKRYTQFVKRQKQNTKANDEAVEKWTEVSKSNPQLGLRKYPVRADKIKYRLWIDQDMCCAYSGRTIGLTQLYSDDTEVDHIIPYSLCLDDSYMNKVVCFSGENRTKAQRTPIDAFEADEDKWEQIKARIEKWDKALHPKRLRFYQHENQLEKDFISSQLNDTRYISKMALTYLQQLGSDITTTKGIMTSWLRHHWGLNSLLSDGDEKERTDHRHHAIDAAVTALIDRPFYQALVKTARELERSSSSYSMRDLLTDEPWDGFRNDLQQSIDKIIVSHQTSSKVEGPLHEETGVGFLNGVGTVYRKEVHPDLKLKAIIDPSVKKILEAHLLRFNNDAKQAFGGDNPVFHKDGKTKIKRVRVRQSNTTAVKLEQDKFGVTDKAGKVFKWHSYGNVHRADVFRDEETGSLSSELVTVMDAKKERLNHRSSDGSDKNKLIFSLYKNDCVSLQLDGEVGVFRLQKISFTNNTVEFVSNLVAKPLKKAQSKILTLNDENIKEYELKKLRVNILGKIV